MVCLYHAVLFVVVIAVLEVFVQTLESSGNYDLDLANGVLNAFYKVALVLLVWSCLARKGLFKYRDLSSLKATIEEDTVEESRDVEPCGL